MTRTFAVNGAILDRGISGSARATQQISEAIAEQAAVDLRVVRPSRPRSRNSLRNAVRDAKWDLRDAARRAGEVDVFVSPCNIGRARPGQRHVLVVFDSMIFECPELFDRRFALYAQILIRYSVRRADRILTLSEHSRQHLMGLAPQGDVRVISLPGRRETPPRTTRGGERVALVVGATEPHKNQAVAVRAIASLRASSGERLRIRLIGPRGRGEPELLAALAEVDPLGEWTTRETGLDDAELDRAYEQAWVLLQPSLNEGYGLPLVEAAQRGLPVVHSGRGAMSEVLPTCSAGGTTSHDFALAMQTLLDDAEWARRSDAAFAESRRFTWDAFSRSLQGHLADL